MQGRIEVKNRGQMLAALCLEMPLVITVAGTNFVLYKKAGIASNEIRRKIGRSSQKLWEVKR